MCRSLSSGQTFYVRTGNESETRDLFPRGDERYLGRIVAVLEPISKGEIHGLIVLKSVHGLLPTKIDMSQVVASTIPPTLEDGKSAGSFLVTVKDLEVDGVSIVAGCCSKFCGGLHEAGQACPALVGSRGSKPVMKCFVSSETENLGEMFGSSEFSELFFTEAAMRVSLIL